MNSRADSLNNRAHDLIVQGCCGFWGEAHMGEFQNSVSSSGAPVDNSTPYRPR